MSSLTLNQSVMNNSSSTSVPTKEQLDKINQLAADGYKYNKAKSISAAGVVLEKGDDLWFFDLDGGIMHNPQCLSFIVH